MAYKDTLRRILQRMIGVTPPTPPVQVTSSEPQPSDSKELLALRWEKYVADKVLANLPQMDENGNIITHH